VLTPPKDALPLVVFALYPMLSVPPIPLESLAHDDEPYRVRKETRYILNASISSLSSGCSLPRLPSDTTLGVTSATASPSSVGHSPCIFSKALNIAMGRVGNSGRLFYTSKGSAIKMASDYHNRRSNSPGLGAHASEFIFFPPQVGENRTSTGYDYHEP
jgi:hypothetical protein